MSERPDFTIEPATDPASARDADLTVDGDAAPARSDELRHVTVECDEAAVCTMYPRGVDEDDAASKWIAATGDSFVSLPASR